MINKHFYVNCIIIIIITLTTDPTKDESDNGEATECTPLLPGKSESGEATKHSGNVISSNQWILPLQFMELH